MSLNDLDLSKPRYGDATYIARFRHFMETTTPLNAFASNRRLAEAAALVTSNRKGETPAGTTENELWEAKVLYDSAYHPNTGKKMLLYGRMSFQVPGNMVITGLMITFYKHPLSVIFWQSANQAFNAAVNVTNHAGDKDIPKKQIIACGIAATTVATTTAISLNRIVKKNQHRIPPLIGRFVPFVAIAAANSVNIPLMRIEELRNGVQLTDKNGKVLGDQRSKTAAQTGIAKSVLSRVIIAFPILIVPPLAMEMMSKALPSLVKNTAMNATFTVIWTGLCLWIAVPMGLAVFPQNSRISVSQLEPAVRESVLQAAPDAETVYYNKGL